MFVRSWSTNAEPEYSFSFKGKKKGREVRSAAFQSEHRVSLGGRGDPGARGSCSTFGRFSGSSGHPVGELHVEKGEVLVFDPQGRVLLRVGAGAQL